jgi:hypothetical protein
MHLHLGSNRRSRLHPTFLNLSRRLSSWVPTKKCSPLRSPTAASRLSAALAGGAKPPDRPSSWRATAAVAAHASPGRVSTMERCQQTRREAEAVRHPPEKSAPSAWSSACTHLVTNTRTWAPRSLATASRMSPSLEPPEAGFVVSSRSWGPTPGEGPHVLEAYAGVQEVAVQKHLRRDVRFASEGASRERAAAAEKQKATRPFWTCLVRLSELVAHFVEGKRPSNAFQPAVAHGPGGREASLPRCQWPAASGALLNHPKLRGARARCCDMRRNGPCSQPAALDTAVLVQRARAPPTPRACPAAPRQRSAASAARVPSAVSTVSSSPDPARPSLRLSADDAFACQWDALQQNDTPTTDAGVETLYAFAVIDLFLATSRYFGASVRLPPHADWGTYYMLCRKLTPSFRALSPTGRPRPV